MRSGFFQKIPDALSKPMLSITYFKFTTFCILAAVSCHFLWDTQVSLESCPTPNACCKTVTPSFTGISTFSAPPDLIHTGHVFFMLIFNPVSYCQGFSNQASDFDAQNSFTYPDFFLFFLG